jgi:pyruvate/2-oxoglutarate dehydrogenase complex dihydrolipoamide dehydrogenase (E3) component
LLFNIPLIESIIDGENGDKEKGYENAGEVLKEGLSLFINVSKFEKHAGTISQTLARLHSKWKRFDEAVEWAKKSLELAYKDNRCYFLHTYGNILKEQFLHLRDKKQHMMYNFKNIISATRSTLHKIAFQHING